MVNGSFLKNYELFRYMSTENKIKAFLKEEGINSFEEFSLIWNEKVLNQ